MYMYLLIVAFALFAPTFGLQLSLSSSNGSAFARNSSGNYTTSKPKIPPSITSINTALDRINNQPIAHDNVGDSYANLLASQLAGHAPVGNYHPVSVRSDFLCLLESGLKPNVTCPGDHAAATAHFFNETIYQLFYDRCFGPNTETSSSNICTGTALETAKSSTSVWSLVKAFMRNTACETAYKAVDATPLPNMEAFKGDTLWRGRIGNMVAETGYCQCGIRGSCVIGGGNVDVYYWPSPHANTSCLSVVGNSVEHDILAGATVHTYGSASTDSVTYWGYTTPGYDGVITTSVYTKINGVPFKYPNMNPWEAQTSSFSSDMSRYNQVKPYLSSIAANTLTSAPARRRGLEKRANPIAIRAPTNGSHPDSPADGSVRTAVVDGYTL